MLSCKALIYFSITVIEILHTPEEVDNWQPERADIAPEGVDEVEQRDDVDDVEQPDDVEQREVDDSADGCQQS